MFFSSNQQNESFQLWDLCFTFLDVAAQFFVFRFANIPSHPPPSPYYNVQKLYCITTLYISAFVFSCCFLSYLYLIFLELLATIPGRKRFRNKVIINSVSVPSAEGEGRLSYLIFLVVRVVLGHGVGAR